MSTKYSVVLTTTGSQQEANQISELLVREKLAACVQRLPITSTYSWQGELVTDSEWLLLIKTKSENFNAVKTAILANHSYNTPEIVQLSIDSGYSKYLTWIDDNTQ